VSGALRIIVGTGGRDRRRRETIGAVVEEAHASGWSVDEIELGDLPDAAATIDRLVVCGGDGLVHQCLPHLAGAGLELGLVPVGTGNDFARAFGIDDDNAVAVATAAADRSTVVEVDHVRAGDRYAASVVTGGYSGRVTDTANGLRFPPGSSKYTVAALLELGRLDAVPVRLTLGGMGGGEAEVIEDDLTMFAIGNTSWFGGGMEICPDADPCDGLLDVVAIGAIGRLSFARWLPRVFRGRHTGHRAVRLGRASSITIATAEPLWADGEPFADAPVTLIVERGALRLLVP
jgi:diacylglycerol kinase (ATP)